MIYADRPNKVRVRRVKVDAAPPVTVDNSNNKNQGGT
jgi:hypothetical protein